MLLSELLPLPLPVHAVQVNMYVFVGETIIIR